MSLRVELLKALFEAVSEHDQVSPKVYWHLLEGDRKNPWDFWLLDEVKLIAFFAAYVFEAGQVEITGMVHPDYRKEGIFKTYFEGLKRRNPQFKQFVFACADCDASKACMEKLEAELEYSELESVMQLPVARVSVAHRRQKSPRRLKASTPFSKGGEMRDVSEEDLMTLVDIDMVCFNSDKKTVTNNFKTMLADKDRRTYLFCRGDKSIGKIHVRFNSYPLFQRGSICEAKQGDFSYLHDLCILPEFQGQGFGEQMLQQTLILLGEMGGQSVSIDVRADNKAALSLYQHCGFKVTNSFNYCLISV